jgi:hypothetical protein
MEAEAETEVETEKDKDETNPMNFLTLLNLEILYSIMVVIFSKFFKFDLKALYRNVVESESIKSCLFSLFFYGLFFHSPGISLICEQTTNLYSPPPPSLFLWLHWHGHFPDVQTLQFVLSSLAAVNIYLSNL